MSPPALRTRRSRSRGHGTPRLRLETLVIGVFGLGGLQIGLRSLADNSAFVHIRTGVDLVRTGRIPRSDPYSFTAHGHRWVVQSWLATALYGWADRVGGWVLGTSQALHGVVLVNAALMALLAVLVARLARTGVAVRTMATAGVAVTFGALYWSPRPLILGLLGLALLITVVEDQANPLWLLPITWIWVNSHGSFPLGAAWLGARIVGEAVDTRGLPRRLWRYAAAELAGLVLAAANPLGPRLLTFALTVGQKAPAFKAIREWHSPNFQTATNLVALGALALALLMISRASLPWRHTLPTVCFVAAGLISMRNLAPAAVVLAPALGCALRPGGGRLDVTADPILPAGGGRGSRLNSTIAATLVLMAVVLGAASLRRPALDVRAYPTKAVAWMGDQGLLDPARHRVAEQDVVGCYLILLRGSAGQVFRDDRVDMYPLAASNDYITLLNAQPASPAILDHARVDAVLWDRHLGLRDVLLSHGGWQVSYEDTGWVVLTRSPAPAV